MKTKLIKILFAIIITLGVLVPVYAKTLSAGVSLTESVPASLMGTWRVASVLKETDSHPNFKKSGVDIWNLSKTGDVISLSNPFTGASASISVSYVNKNTVKFSKEGDYDRQKLTDTVEITLEGDKFNGINHLKLETISDVNNSVISVKTATYVLRGEKISGTSILER